MNNLALYSDGTTFRTFQEYTYKDVTVPKDFPTDGITGKFRIVYLFIAKYDPRVIEAVVVHDYLCELEEYDKADRYFKEMLPDIWQKKYMISAVKRYHDITE